MAELEKNPQMLRQGAVAVASVAVASAALPAISHRAAEQRADAQWAARAASFQQAMIGDMERAANAEPGRAPLAAAVTLASASGEGGGVSVKGAGGWSLPAAEDGHALLVQAGLKDQAALASLAPFQPARLGFSRAAAKEQHCLAQAIYFEARGESLAGQAAVAEVVLNRVRSAHYPDTFCEVVYQGSWRSTGCQFTFTCDGSLKHKPRGESWRRANLIAAQTLMGISRPLTHRATHYHTTEVSPVWSASLVETTRIGAHIFYRMPSRRERALIFARQTAPAFEAPALDPVSPGEPSEPPAVLAELRGSLPTASI